VTYTLFKDEPACQIPRSKVISISSYCSDTETHDTIQYNTIRKFITRTCSQALSLNRRRGQSLGGQTECVNCL